MLGTKKLWLVLPTLSMIACSLISLWASGWGWIRFCPRPSSIICFLYLFIARPSSPGSLGYILACPRRQGTSCILFISLACAVKLVYVARAISMHRATTSTTDYTAIQPYSTVVCRTRATARETYAPKEQSSVVRPLLLSETLLPPRTPPWRPTLTQPLLPSRFQVT